MKIDSVLKRFPKIQLSYEKVAHKKVDSDFCVAIPAGKKYFAWFTHYGSGSACILLEIYKKTQLCDIRLATTCYKEDLATNTVVYGTLVKNRYFFIEDCYYYKNQDVSHYSNKQSCELLKYIFDHELKQVDYMKNSIIFGLPIMVPTYRALAELPELPYKIYCIQFRNAYGDKKKLNYAYKPEVENVVFRVKPEVKNDVYSLYCISNGMEEYYDMAYIPNYKTSVFMNSIFRNIKENVYLDALEESDDEEVFENTADDKFIKNDEAHDFLCEFNPKFKKWVPIKMVNNMSIIQKKYLSAFEKK